MTTLQSLDFSEPATNALVVAEAKNEGKRSKERLGSVLQKTDKFYAKVLHEFTEVLDGDNGGNDFSSVVALDKARSTTLDRRWTIHEIGKLFHSASRRWNSDNVEEHLQQALKNTHENQRLRTASEEPEEPGTASVD